MNFRDCFLIVRIGFSRLFSGSLGLCLDLVLISGLISSGFVEFFGITEIF